MSNSSMNEPTSGLVPRLRFPEFRESGEWEERPLSDTCRVTQGGTPDTKVSDLWGGTVQWLTPAEMGKSESKYIAKTIRSITEKGLSNCSSELLPVNSVIISTRAPIGHLAINHTPMAINQGCRGLVPSPGFDFHFIYYILEKSKSRLNDLGSGNTFKELSGSTLKSFILVIPQPQEQHKIAACLSSLDALIAAQADKLDALIAAQADKLDALKTHKKGLMQRLFPREGETVPRLRFPEFREAGEWEVTLLGKLSSIVRGGSPRPIDKFLTRDLSGLNWLKIGDVEKDAKYVTHTEERVIQEALNKTREVNPGDLIMSNSMSFGRPYILKIKSCIHDGWIAVTRIVGFIDSNYLYYFILSNPSQLYFMNAAAGGGVRNLNADIIKLLTVKYPAIAEQRKIAACLSSLDALIAAQADKLDALKTHKKGLMQQLFPSPEAISA